MFVVYGKAFILEGSVNKVDSKARVLAKMIDERGSRRAFAEEVGLPPTTLQSMLQRGVGRASIDNVIKVCRALDITVEQLDEMANKLEKDDDIETIAAHRDGDEEWTEEELKLIEEFKEFVRSQRDNREE